MKVSILTEPANPSWIVSRRIIAFATSLIALGVYLLTIAPDVTWANAALDGVELVTASATLGIPHPPGYPTYVVLGKVFSWLPMGSVAFRYNLFSALTIAGAAGMLVLAIGVLHTGIRPSVAMATSLLFAFAPLVWSQAVVAEIYGLNLLLLAIFLFVWLRQCAHFWSGFWLGLAMTTHLTSVFFLPALLLDGRPNKIQTLAGVIAGLFPLLLLPVIGTGDSPIIWGEPTSMRAWVWLISGRLYAANLRLEFDFAHLANIIQMVVLGPAGMIVGQLMSQTTHAGKSTKISTRRVNWLLGITATIYVLFALFYHTPDAAINLLPAFMIIALLIAPWLDHLGRGALLLPIILVVLTFSARDLSEDYEVRLNAQHLLNETPEGALLLTPGNRTIFTILYLQHVEKIRPDIRVADANLFAFDWYRDRLKAQYPDLYVPEGDDLNSFQQVNAESRPFCLADLVAGPDLSSVGRATIAEQSSGSPQLDCK